jgi:hypothetical protein
LLSEKNILRYLRDQKVTLVASARLDVAGEQRLERKGDWISEYAHLFNLHMDSDYYQVWMVRRERLDDESLWVPTATLKGNATPK